MTNWILWLGLILLSPTVEIGGIVALGTPFLVFGGYLRSLQFYNTTFQLKIGPSGALAAMYLLCIMVSLVWSPLLFVSGFRALYHVIGFVLFLSLLQQQGTDRDFQRVRSWAFAITCAGLAIAIHFLMLMGKLTIEGRLAEAFADRITGGVMSLPWAGSNTIAAAILTSIYPGLILPRSLGYFAKCAVAAMLLAILATLSRNSSTCVLASVVVYACLSGRASSTIGALMGIGMVVGIGLSQIDADVFSFIVTSRVENAEMGSFNGRTDCWAAVGDEICRRLPYPVGFYGSIPTLGHTAHNLILTDAFELGIWGLGIHLMLLASITAELWIARSLRRRAGQSADDLNILLSGLFGITVNLMFEDPQFTQPYIIFSWIFMGICIAATRLPRDLRTFFSESTTAVSHNSNFRQRPPINRPVRNFIARHTSNRASW